MKLKYFTDKKELIMRSKENCVDSMTMMELAFQNILNEIIEHVIEGVCFEAHRAVKLGYFAVNEYVIKELKFEIYSDEDRSIPMPNGDIFANDQKILTPYATCPRCNEMKATNVLTRHLYNCRGKPNGSSNSDNTCKRENYDYDEDEDNSDGNDNYDRKKGNDAKKQAKSARNYDTMTPEQKHDFLLKYCGVVTKRTKKPCSNSKICNKHSTKAKEEVRSSIFEGLADHLVDDNIDFDTV